MHAEFIGSHQLENFKAEIKRLAAPSPITSGATTRPMLAGEEILPLVFIHAGIEDRDQARSLSKVLSDLNCLTFLPMEAGTPEEIRSDLERNLKDCDGLILFWGRIPLTWVREQFGSLHRILPERMKLDPPRQLPALAICKAPPPNKPDLGVSGPRLQILDICCGVTAENLRPWVASLQTGGAS